MFLSDYIICQRERERESEGEIGIIYVGSNLFFLSFVSLDFLLFDIDIPFIRCARARIKEKEMEFTINYASRLFLLRLSLYAYCSMPLVAEPSTPISRREHFISIDRRHVSTMQALFELRRRYVTLTFPSLRALTTRNEQNASVGICFIRGRNRHKANDQ